MTNIPMLQEIKVRREDLGIAQKQLAKLCDIKPSLLNMVEKGNAKLSYGNLVTIFKVLDKKAEESLKNVKIAGKICVKNLFYVKKNDYLEDVINTMKIKDISQIPVIDSSGCIGLVTEHSTLNFVKENSSNSLRGARAKDAMEMSPPIIDWDQKISPRILDLLHGSKCLLVSERGEIIGIITKIDAIRSLSKK